MQPIVLKALLHAVPFNAHHSNAILSKTIEKAFCLVQASGVKEPYRLHTMGLVY